MNKRYNKDMKTREIEVIRLITDEAKMKRLEYQRAYRERNRERINAKHREWRKANPEKNIEYIQRYWNKKVMEHEQA